MSELLPCPFCGNETPEFERVGSPRQSCIVICGSCGARHESSDEGARNGSSWNLRASAQAAQPSDAERLDWLEKNVSETMMRPSQFCSEFAPDTRLRYEFPTLVSFDSIGQQISLRDAIDAAIRATHPTEPSHTTTHVTDREPHPNAFMQVPAGTEVTAHWPALTDPTHPT